ncbi:MAG: hypothetical protein BGO09_02995 [Bacteroidetes bacterium 47-18]|nr:MAG: hypothetical protein BGO09_02995 [Bacteroidetes bacterium 47-18]
MSRGYPIFVQNSGMKYLFLAGFAAVLIFSACNKAIAPYTCTAFDRQQHVATIIITGDLDRTIWLNTSMYVLDSISMDMSRKQTPKGSSISVITYANEQDALAGDTSRIRGRYTYMYDTKEQQVDFRQ